jgi:hypothetical protein
MLVQPTTFERLASTALTGDVFGEPLQIAALESILALKLHALKMGEEHRRAKDTNDIPELCRLGSIKIESQEFKDLALKYSNEEIWRRLKSLQD